MNAALDKLPRERMNGVNPRSVREDPIGSGRDLRREVSIPRCCHRPRGSGGHIQIKHHDARSGTRHGDLQTIASHRRTESAVAVHRGGCGQNAIGLLKIPGCELGQIIQGARPDGDSQSTGAPQRLANLLGVIV